MQHYDIIVIGGGLSGLTAAIDLGRKGYRILVLEEHRYPRHKVCGEYVSNEVLPYLQRLGISLAAAGAIAIDTLAFSTVNGKRLETRLAMGGKGISRHAFDELLYRRAREVGVEFEFCRVIAVRLANSADVNESDSQGVYFKVDTDSDKTFTSTISIGAYGKRSGLDKSLKRDFASKKSSWLAVKAHYEHDSFPERSVALHNFRGGYGGLSRTEMGAVNFCYLVTYSSFRKEKDITEFNANVVSENPFLGQFLKEAVPLFDAPLTIAQVSFHPKKTVESHLLMCGDSAGLIHPLCGNGMAMAIHSAKIAAEQVDVYLKDDKYSRTQMERDYRVQWHRTFAKRLWVGRRLQSFLLNPTLSRWGLSSLMRQPYVLRKIIESTHGKPIR